MIQKFNQKQTVLAVVNACLGVIAFVLAFVFFWHAMQYIADGFSLPIDRTVSAWIAIGIVAVIALTGFVGYSRGMGHTEMAESDLTLNFLDGSTAGSFYMRYYGSQVTGPAYLLSQIFLAGPLQIGKCIDRLRSRIPESPELEKEMAETLEFARNQKGWHGITEYRGRERVASYLIRIGALEYSGRKGRARVADGW